MKIYLTSDTHFSHSNILEYCKDTRPYKSIEHMNEIMINQWNEIVQDNDLVYHLGDVGFGSVEDLTTTVNRLNGRKVLIKGNHDLRYLKHQQFCDCFEEIHNYHEIKFNKIKIVLFHYPIKAFHGQDYGAIHCHGHLHSTPSGLEQFRIRNVGVDYTKKIVSLLDDVVKDAITGEIKHHHNR